MGAHLYTELLRLLSAQRFRHAFAGIALPDTASVALHESPGFRHLGTYASAGFKLGARHNVGGWQLTLESDPGLPDEIIPFSDLGGAT